MEISLCFINWLCRSNLSSKGGFPRVTKIELYLGEETCSQRWRCERSCQTGPEFWYNYLSGLLYPDLKSIRIHHYWAAPHSQAVNLWDQAKVCTYPTWCPLSHFSLPSLRRERLQDWDRKSLHDQKTIGSYQGLKKLEEIFLENPPEVTAADLRYMFHHKVSESFRLRKLSLRFCRVTLKSIEYLLQQRLPNLTHLTLLIGYQEPHAEHNPPHLCPLVRQFSKGLVYLKYAAPHICRGLFFTNDELNLLKQSGVMSSSDGYEEAEDDVCSHEHAVQQLIIRHRAQKAQIARNWQVREAITRARFDDFRSKRSDRAIVRCNTELRLDRADEARKHIIANSNPPWKRSIISWERPCIGSWADLQVGASIGEEGIEWTLTSMYLIVTDD